jgi:hypothetical protein
MLQKSGARPTGFLGLAIAIALIAGGTSFGIRKVCAQSSSHKVVAYYFHTNTRCDTCRKIEAYSHEAIEEGFKAELKNGTLELRVVNYEERENRHYIKDYQLVSKSLILVNMVDGKQTEWMNLKLVWELVKNKKAFLNYVRGEVRNYLSKN